MRIDRAGWLLCVVLVAACGARDDPETRITRTIDDLIESVESARVDDFMARIADDFAASERRLDRSALRALLMRERLARSRVSVTRGPVTVQLIGQDRAQASFEALVTGGAGWLPDEAQLWHLDTGWRLTDGQWQLLSAHWRRVGETRD